MDRINQYVFYDLGKLFKGFISSEQDISPVAVFFDVMHARGTLNRLISEGVPMQLGLSRGPAQEFLQSLNRIYDAHFTEMSEGKQVLRFPDGNDGAIPSWRWNSVARDLDRFETVFQEELREAATYIVPSRGIYRTPALIDEADKTFPAEVIGHIPPKALGEWRAAGRCLAFNLLTASGFHVARSVEGTLESYYQLFCKSAGKTEKTWQDYIDQLSKVDQGQFPLLPEGKTMAKLRQMKDDYRNPLMHPRVVLNDADARILYNDGESLIIAMAQEICAAAKRQPAVALVTADARPIALESS